MVFLVVSMGVFPEDRAELTRVSVIFIDITGNSIDSALESGFWEPFCQDLHPGSCLPLKMGITVLPYFVALEN